MRDMTTHILTHPNTRVIHQCEIQDLESNKLLCEFFCAVTGEGTPGKSILDLFPTGPLLFRCHRSMGVEQDNGQKNKTAENIVSQTWNRKSFQEIQIQQVRHFFLLMVGLFYNEIKKLF